MQFPVLVVLDVEHGSFFTQFYRTFHLSFVPTIGLELTQGYWSSGVIEQVAWDEEIKAFICRPRPNDWLNRDYPDDDQRPSKQNVFEQLVSQGWLRTPNEYSWASLLGQHV